MGTHSVEHFICLLYALDYLKAKKLKSSKRGFLPHWSYQICDGKHFNQLVSLIDMGLAHCSDETWKY